MGETKAEDSLNSSLDSKVHPLNGTSDDADDNVSILDNKNEFQID
jgi:hypothetical protein